MWKNKAPNPITSFSQNTVALAIAFCAVAACQSSHQEVDTHRAHRDDGTIIATVNGEGISAEHLEAAQNATPSASAAEVLAQLIQTTALAQEARARQVLDPYRARWLRRQAAVKRLLQREVEGSVSADSISHADLMSTYDSFALGFGNPTLVTASHLLIALPQESRTDAEIQQAIALLQSLRERLLTQTPSDADLIAAARQLLLAGFDVDVNIDLTFPLRPVPAMPGKEPVFRAVVQPFADAAFALSADAPLSEPVLTSFGVHLILWKHRREEQRPPLAVIEDWLREELVNRTRYTHFDALLTRLRESASIQMDEDLIRDLAREAAARR